MQNSFPQTRFHCRARKPNEHAGSVAELVGSFGRLNEKRTRWCDT